MKAEYKSLLDLLNKKPKTVKRVSDTLRKMRKGEADKIMHTLHEEAFETIDCLQCANCCTTTGPLLTSNDIDRIAKHLGLKPIHFIEQYLHIDEDGDYVFKSMPCPFLGADNYCTIYEQRPKACREYPHTDRANQQGILSLTRKNTKICPAVANIFLNIERDMKG